jgi:hypothetical protein
MIWTSDRAVVPRGADNVPRYRAVVGSEGEPSLNPADIIVTIEHPWGDVGVMLATWMARGPGSRRAIEAGVIEIPGPNRIDKGEGPRDRGPSPCLREGTRGPL